MQLIFGANGPSGRAYIRTLTDSADVVAVLRKPSEDSFLPNTIFKPSSPMHLMPTRSIKRWHNTVPIP